MPILQPYEAVNLPDAGATRTVTGLDIVGRYILTLTGTGTLSGNFSLTDEGNAPIGSIYNVEFPGGVTLGSNTCTIFGKALTTQQALTPCLIVARWVGSGVFQTQFYTDWSSSNNVTAAQILANAVTTIKILDANVTLAKLEALNRGNVYRGNSSNRPEAYNLLGVGAGAILSANATDAVGQLFSGDFTNNATLVATIANNAITSAKILDTAVTLAKWANLARGNFIAGDASARPAALNLPAVGAGGYIFTDGVDALVGLMTGDGSLSGAGALTISAGLNSYVLKVTIPTASVLTSNSVPVALVGAVAGKIIRPIACMETLTYNSIAYATNGISALRHDTATDALMTLGSSFLFGTTTKTAEMAVNAINSVTDTQGIVNKNLLWETQTGDPTAGNSSVTILLLYELVTP